MKLNMKIAKLIKDDLTGFRGHAALYQVNPPMVSRSWDEPEKSHDFVIVSSSNVWGRPETYIFPATRDGKVIDWLEMDGSQKDVYSHNTVLWNAGYDIVR
jgi:hypothetical protein